MKTKDLIQRLQQCDPSGELEVCCDNEDINSVQTTEAYYDGKLQVLKRDDRMRVVGAKITNNGHKVQIRSKSIQEAVYINPELPVELDLEDYQKPEYERTIDEWRRTARKIREDIKKENRMETATAIVTPTQENPKIHQGRWGYYPCSHETYLKLKRLNKHYERALHQVACWNRWNNKHPQNRVLRRWTKDAQGRKNGFEVIGPAPEPRLVEAMTEVVVRPGWKFLAMKCVDITQEYRKARYPATTPDKIRPLSITIEKIDAMLRECGE